MKTNISKKEWANSINSEFYFVLMFLIGVSVGCHSVKLPIVINENPSLSEIQQAVNQNSAKIKTLQSKNASVGVSSISGMANCQLAFERERRVRLIGNANMMGRVIDCGCNDELFWFWSKFQDPVQISYCRLNELSSNSLTDSIPIDPTWFPEVLGIVEFKTDEEAEGPISQSDGTLLVKTKKKRSNGQYTKYTYIEPKTAAVKRQDIQDPNGNTVISVLCTEFQYIESQKIVLPQKLVIHFPKSNDALHLNLGDLSVNSSENIQAGIFEMPKSSDLNNSPVVNIGTASGIIPGIKQPTETETPAQTNETAFQEKSISSDSFQPVQSAQPVLSAQSVQASQPVRSTQPVYSFQNPIQGSAIAQNMSPNYGQTNNSSFNENNSNIQNTQNNSVHLSDSESSVATMPGANSDMLLSDSSLMTSYSLPQSNSNNANQQTDSQLNNFASDSPFLKASPNFNNVPPVLNQTTNLSNSPNLFNNSTPSTPGDPSSVTIPTETFNPVRSNLLSGNQQSVESTSSYKTQVIP
ncbi:MAG: hypothetical protein Q4C95_06000 [Planctomycetia bacterium]|nr:hypothetical protein [Planctomycetia bacterium]